MTKLVLGVVDLPYVEAPSPPQKVKKGSKVGQGPKTGPAVMTGEVAVWLENKYHVMEHFFEARQDKIGDLLVEKLEDVVEAILNGAPPTLDPYGEAMDDIAGDFQDFILTKQLDSLGFPGIPTRASLDGVNHALKLKKGPPRPSFKDTGLYIKSFKAWIEE